MELTDINEVRALLARHGFRFSKSLGQNFLVASWVPRDIADSAGLDENTGVLEIGPGIGCLTKELSLRAGKVAAVELDESLKDVLAETLSGCANVDLIFGDILRQDIHALAARHFTGLRPVVCANLPYNVTSPLLTAFLTAGYGAFGIFVQWYMTCELLFDVAPGCFIPQPKVTSSVIRLTRRAEKPYPVRDEALFFRIIRVAFNQRRKTLVNALSAGLGLDKADIERAVTACGLDARVRGEALDAGQFVSICEKISDL